LVERYRSLSLRTKFAIHIAASSVLLFAALIPALVYLQKRVVLEETKQRGMQLAKVFAHSSVQAVVADDFLVLRHIIDSIASDPDVLYAMIQDASGRLLVHSDMKEAGKTYTDSLTEVAIRTESPLLQEVWRPDQQAYDFAVPIYILNERRAVARVGISLERELVQIASTRNYIFLLGIIFSGLGLVWATYQAKRVARPIQALVRGTEEIARGNLGHKIAVESGDELGQLAQAFNRMTESVQALIETSRELSSVLDTGAVLRSIASHALNLVKADIAFIAPLSRGGEEARIEVVLGARTEGLQNLVVTPGLGIGGRVLATGESFFTPNYLDDPRIVHDPLYDEVVKEEEIISQLAVPITLKGNIVGLLWVAYRVPKTFSQENVDSLQRMAQQVAIAMENARLYGELRRSHQELLAAQDELVQKTRMAAMGEIAAIVAHEIRNPLGALGNCVGLLRTNPHLTGEDTEVLNIIQAESQRLNEIVSDFLTFGRPRPPQLQEVDLHEVIEETVALLGRDERCPPSITFLRKFDPSIQKVRADRDQLRQVFWNLFLNAVQAAGENGTVCVETRRLGDQAEISVRDTGPGIPTSVLPKIFEPFYTTRSGGTGLGLPIVRRIVQDHGGRVAVNSQLGVGTCFLVSLPIVTGTSDGQDPRG
jgi:signal transduction histidine kinase